MSVADNLRRIRATLPAGVELVAVSKFHPVEALREAYDAGQRVFGESRQQELLQKIPLMPDDVRWHFIGHLQTNKVRSLVGRVALVESVDTERLLSVISAESERAGVVTDVLLEVHVAMEDTKYGFSAEGLAAFFAGGDYLKYPGVRYRGVMGMASNTDDEARVSDDFRRIADTFRAVGETVPGLEAFDTLSMGMSHDYPLAIAAGANLVRIGTAIFGDRGY